MSKVVKKVGKGISKVVKGVKKAVSSAWKSVKKSPILKTIAIAGLAYFGGAALLGGFGSMGAGGGFMQGMSAGFSNAMTGVSSAWSSAVGGNFATAGSQLAGGLTQAGAAGAGTVGSVTGNAASLAGLPSSLAPSANGTAGMANYTGLAADSAAKVAGATGQVGAATQAGSQALSQPLFTGQELAGLQQANAGVGTGLSNATAVGGSTAPSGGGLLSGAANFVKDNPLLSATALNTGGQMLSGYSNARAQEDAERDARLRYGQNVGSFIKQPVWDPQQQRYVVPA